MVEEREDIFVLYNEELQLASLRKSIANGISIGDWVDFIPLNLSHFLEEEKEQQQIALDPRKVVVVEERDGSPLRFPVRLNPNSNYVEVKHTVRIQAAKKHKYEVKGLGEVIDSKGLIRKLKMKGQYKGDGEIEVYSCCIVDWGNRQAEFHITAIITQEEEELDEVGH